MSKALMDIDPSIVLGWVINASISFFFGVLGGVVSHILIREYDRRANESERRARLRRRILLPPRKWVDAAWRKLLPPVVMVTAALFVGIITGSLWATLGIAVVMGFVVGRVWM